MALTETQAALIKGMLKRGDKQSDIAAWFRCNAGRIAEVNKGWRHPKVRRRRLRYCRRQAPII